MLRVAPTHLCRLSSAAHVYTLSIIDVVWGPMHYVLVATAPLMVEGRPAFGGSYTTAAGGDT